MQISQTMVDAFKPFNPFMVNVVSNSQGRTSTYTTKLVHALCKIDGNPFDCINMDTGAEDDGTYEFARYNDKMFKSEGIDITYLRLRADTPLRKRNNVDIVNVEETTFDLTPFGTMCEKYSTPSIGTPFCTSRMKLEIFNNHLKAKYGIRNYITWLGIRCDEPARMWGKDAYYPITKLLEGDKDDICEMYTKLSAMYRSGLHTKEDIVNVAGDDWGFVLGAGKQSDPKNRFEETGVTEDHIELMYDRLVRIAEERIRYLGEISNFTKEDILKWWKTQSHDLTIPEHLGNCIFCFKKSDIKLALAARDRPEHLKKWLAMIEGPNIRVKPQRKTANNVMYRAEKKLGFPNGRTLQQIIEMYKDVPTDVLREKVYRSRMDDTGSCSESCEINPV